MMDGMKLIEKVRAEAPEVHMVLLSGFNEFEYARHALRHGVVDYLSKPVNRKELNAVLLRILYNGVSEAEERRRNAEGARTSRQPGRRADIGKT